MNYFVPSRDLRFFLRNHQFLSWAHASLSLLLLLLQHFWLQLRQLPLKESSLLNHCLDPPTYNIPFGDNKFVLYFLWAQLTRNPLHLCDVLGEYSIVLLHYFTLVVFSFRLLNLSSFTVVRPNMLGLGRKQADFADWAVLLCLFLS